MRSKKTNFLQAVVMITGILYVLFGLVFYVSPFFFSNVFGVAVPEDWFTQIKYDAVVAPLYFIARGLSALLCAIGAAMVLPLFDPIRYRGLIYFTGIIFPAMSAFLLLRNGFLYKHAILIMLGCMFGALLAATAAGLMLTKNEALAVGE